MSSRDKASGWWHVAHLALAVGGLLGWAWMAHQQRSLSEESETA